MKKDRMTKNERWEALLKGLPVDRVPVYGYGLGFSAVNTSRSLVDFYNNAQMSYDAQIGTAGKFGFQDIPRTVYASFGAWEFGGEVRYPSGDFDQAPVVIKYPVSSEEDALNLKAPDIEKPVFISFMKDIVRIVNRTESPYLWCLVCSPFTVAGNLCGIENLLRWTKKRPEIAHRLIQLATDFCGDLAQSWVDEFGAERVLAALGEPSSSNQLISPKMFETFALPYIKTLNERILAMGIHHIYFHICGDHNLNLPYWAQIPMGNPGLVSFGHEIDLSEASGYFPNDIIVGNIEPALFQAGTPEQVYEAAKSCIEKGLTHPCGFMIAPGCEMPPMAVEENVWAMMKAVNDFGWYD